MTVRREGMIAEATRVTLTAMQHLQKMHCKMSALMSIVINPRSKALGRVKYTEALKYVKGLEVQNQ